MNLWLLKQSNIVILMWVVATVFAHQVSWGTIYKLTSKQMMLSSLPFFSWKTTYLKYSFFCVTRFATTEIERCPFDYSSFSLTPFSLSCNSFRFIGRYQMSIFNLLVFMSILFLRILSYKCIQSSVLKVYVIRHKNIVHIDRYRRHIK